MWWIIAIAVLIVGFLAFIILFVQGADQRKNNDYTRQREDEEQEKAMTEYTTKQKKEGHP